MSQEPQNSQGSRPTDQAASKDAIVQLAKIYQNAPPKLLGVIVILGIVAIVTLAFALTFLGSKNPDDVLAFFVFFLLFAIVAIGVFLYQSRELPPQKIVESMWDRLILKYPPSKLEDLEKTLRKSHEKIEEFIIKSVDSNIERENLRTKIFLPKYKRDDNVDGAGRGYVCTLVIPLTLRVHMTGHDDANLKLRPGEGLSGRAFVLESVCKQVLRGLYDF